MTAKSQTPTLPGRKPMARTLADFGTHSAQPAEVRRCQP